MKNYYDPTPEQLKLAKLGRRLMDHANSVPMKGMKDAEIGYYNRMSSFGDTLTRVGTLFGPRTLPEILKAARVEKAEAQEFIKIATGA